MIKKEKKSSEINAQGVKEIGGNKKRKKYDSNREGWAENSTMSPAQ